MKYYYIAKINVFKGNERVGEKILYTSKFFDSEHECRNYGYMYQYNHGCIIEYHVKEN